MMMLYRNKEDTLSRASVLNAVFRSSSHIFESEEFDRRMRRKVKTEMIGPV